MNAGRSDLCTSGKKKMANGKYPGQLVTPINVRASSLFSALVVDVWNANPSRLDGSAIRYHGAANHPYLHGRRIGFSRFLRGSIGRPKRELLRALPLVFLTRRRHQYGERMQTPSSGWQR